VAIVLKTEAGGMGQRLALAPIYFALVQVHFNTVLALDDYVPKIQERMRGSRFPEFAKLVSATFNLNIGAPADALSQVPIEKATNYVFSNFERTSRFTLGQESLSFETTDYRDFDEFSKTFAEGLRFIHELVKLNVSKRVGMRCLDAVVPGSTESIAEYLDPSLVGLLDKLDRDLEYVFSETRTKRETTTLVSRAIIQSGGGAVVMPADIQLMNLELLPRFKEVSGRYAILDTDCWDEKPEPFDIANVLVRAKQVHEEGSNSFALSVTPHAINKWS